MAATIFNIRPEDGWTAVTTNDNAFIKIRTNVPGHGFQVQTGTSVPAATVQGYKVQCDEEFMVDVPAGSDVNYYVRTYEGAPAGQRISVFAIDDTGA